LKDKIEAVLGILKGFFLRAIFKTKKPRRSLQSNPTKLEQT